MSRSIYNEAASIATFVARRIRRLQDGDPAKAPQSSSSRAALARLRRLGAPGCSWMSVGGELFDGWPELDLSSRDEEKMTRAVIGSLRLYAFHQQSKQVSMAWIPDDSQEGEDRSRVSRKSFGWSCWALEPDREKSQGIRQRMASIETSNDFAGVEHHMRALISLMRGKDVKVDYWSLSRDLYLIQFDGARDWVFAGWARDYFASKGSEDAREDAANNAASADAEGDRER